MSDYDNAQAYAQSFSDAASADNEAAANNPTDYQRSASPFQRKPGENKIPPQRSFAAERADQSRVGGMVQPKMGKGMAKALDKAQGPTRGEIENARAVVQQNILKARKVAQIHWKAVKQFVVDTITDDTDLTDYKRLINGFLDNILGKPDYGEDPHKWTDYIRGCIANRCKEATPAIINPANIDQIRDAVLEVARAEGKMGDEAYMIELAAEEIRAFNELREDVRDMSQPMMMDVTDVGRKPTTPITAPAPVKTPHWANDASERKQVFASWNNACDAHRVDKAETVREALRKRYQEAEHMNQTPYLDRSALVLHFGKMLDAEFPMAWGTDPDKVEDFWMFMEGEAVDFKIAPSELKVKTHLTLKTLYGVTDLDELPASVTRETAQTAIVAEWRKAQTPNVDASNELAEAFPESAAAKAARDAKLVSGPSGPEKGQRVETAPTTPDVIVPSKIERSSGTLSPTAEPPVASNVIDAAQRFVHPDTVIVYPQDRGNVIYQGVRFFVSTHYGGTLAMAKPLLDDWIANRDLIDPSCLVKQTSAPVAQVAAVPRDEAPRAIDEPPDDEPEPAPKQAQQENGTGLSRSVEGGKVVYTLYYLAGQVESRFPKRIATPQAVKLLEATLKERRIAVDKMENGKRYNDIRLRAKWVQGAEFAPATATSPAKYYTDYIAFEWIVSDAVPLAS